MSRDSERSNRLLLCRPQGGLNDMLCQIERACRYAERFDRTVVVETDYSGTRFFGDALSRYFVSQQSRLVLDADGIRHRIDDLTVFPGFLAGRANRYRARYEHAVGNYVDEESSRPVSFDFDADYPQALLVHHACGGGTLSIGALSRMRLSDDLAHLLRERLAAIGGSYGGLHIRNTDYRTEYEAWLMENRSKLAGPLFVATDNRDTIEHCRRILGSDRVHSFAKLDAEVGEPMHPLSERADAYTRNCDAILDLLMLACAEQLYLFRIMANPNGVSYSGFSILAANLKNSPPLLRQLVSPPARSGRNQPDPR